MEEHRLQVTDSVVTLNKVLFLAIKFCAVWICSYFSQSDSHWKMM